MTIRYVSQIPVLRSMTQRYFQTKKMEEVTKQGALSFRNELTLFDAAKKLLPKDTPSGEIISFANLDLPQIGITENKIEMDKLTQSLTSPTASQDRTLNKIALRKDEEKNPANLFSAIVGRLADEKDFLVKMPAKNLSVEHLYTVSQFGDDKNLFASPRQLIANHIRALQLSPAEKGELIAKFAMRFNPTQDSSLLEIDGEDGTVTVPWVHFNNQGAHAQRNMDVIDYAKLLIQTNDLAEAVEYTAGAYSMLYGDYQIGNEETVHGAFINHQRIIAGFITGSAFQYFGNSETDIEEFFKQTLAIIYSGDQEAQNKALAFIKNMLSNAGQ